MKGKYRIYLKPEDFIGNEFLDIKNCPLATAIKRQLKINYASVGETSCGIGESIWDNEEYKIIDNFTKQMYKAIKNEYQRKYPIEYYVDLIKKDLWKI